MSDMSVETRVVIAKIFLTVFQKERMLILFLNFI